MFTFTNTSFAGCSTLTNKELECRCLYGKTTKDNPRHNTKHITTNIKLKIDQELKKGHAQCSPCLKCNPTIKMAVKQCFDSCVKENNNSTHHLYSAILYRKDEGVYVKTTEVPLKGKWYNNNFL